MTLKGQGFTVALTSAPTAMQRALLSPTELVLILQRQLASQRRHF